MSNNFLQAQAQASNNQLGLIEESRQIAEVKGKIFLAKQFPRDINAAISNIMAECKTKKLAETATYAFPRGDATVSGPSIRLAEVVARHWGNFESGVVELEQRMGESTIKVFAWDFESNYRDEKTFTVKHERSKGGKTFPLTDSRDIYEKVANDAARRKRACILAVIPSYVFDEALEVCEKTLKDDTGNVEEKRNNMAEYFAKLNDKITKEVLSKKIAKPFDKFDAKDIVRLKNLYNSINDGFVKAEDAFDFTEPQTEQNEQKQEQKNQTKLDDL